MNWGGALQTVLYQPYELMNYNRISGMSTSFLDISEQRKKDEEFINNFMLNIQKKKFDLRPATVKISEARAMLIDIIQQLKEVKKSIFSLSTTDSEFSSKFGIFETELYKLNEKIVDFDFNVKDPLLKGLKKRLKKRKARKEKNLKFKEWKKAQLIRVKQKHEMIDKLLLEKQEEVESIKREAAFKCQADSVLLEVRRKKNEAKKILNLLPALTKLRDLRSREEEKVGGYVSKPLSEAFNQVIQRFQNLWERQLEMYKLEEKGLKITLEESSMPCRKLPELETNLLQWEKAFFGDVMNDDNENLLTMANVDLQALVEVRREWDQFLAAEMTLMASNIPLGWVLPSETENEDWKTFASCKK